MTEARQRKSEAACRRMREQIRSHPTLPQPGAIYCTRGEIVRDAVLFWGLVAGVTGYLVYRAAATRRT